MAEIGSTPGTVPGAGASPAGAAVVPTQQRRTLILNGLANVGGALVPIPILLALIPYALGKIGTSAYGAWALVSALAAAAQLADFGIAAVVTRHIAFYHAAREADSVAEIVHAATALYLVIGAALMLFGWAAWPWVARLFFRDAGVPIADVRFVFLGSMAIFAGTFAISGFGALLDGFQRIVVANVLRTTGALAGGVATFWLLAAGFGLRAMLAGPASALLVRLIGLAYLVPRLSAESARLPLRLRRRRMREITAFSARLAVVQLSGFGHYQLPKLFLGLLAPVAAVGAYEIAATQMQRIQNLVTGLIYPFLPALATTAGVGGGAGDAEHAASLYRMSHRLLSILLVPFVAGVVVFAPDFVALWLGHKYESLGTVFILAGIGTAALVLTAPTHYLLIGHARMRPDVERSAIALILTVAGVVFGIRVAGLVGATAATAFAAAAAVGWLQFRARRIEAVRLAAPLVRANYVRVLVATVPAAAIAALALALLPLSYSAFVAAVLVFGLVLGVVGNANGALRPAELRQLFVRPRSDQALVLETSGS